MSSERNQSYPSPPSQLPALLRHLSVRSSHNLVQCRCFPLSALCYKYDAFPRICTETVRRNPDIARQSELPTRN